MREEFMNNFDIEEMKWKKSWRPRGEKDTAVKELIEEITLENPEWVRERRLEYLNNLRIEIEKEITRWVRECDKYNSLFKEKIFKICVLPQKKEREKILKEIENYKNPKWQLPNNTRISEQDILSVKEKPISDFIEFKNRFALCIFHQEKTPSLWLNPDNTCHCFGCGRHEDIIGVVRFLYGYSFIEAVNFLKK